MRIMIADHDSTVDSLHQSTRHNRTITCLFTGSPPYVSWLQWRGQEFFMGGGLRQDVYKIYNIMSFINTLFFY